jgi:DNA repair exonuclease SbcCD ATPase subunit
MSDIVERLREDAGGKPPTMQWQKTYHEAADEIERLRAENEWRRSAAKAWQLIAQTNQELCDEIERLHTALIELNETVEDYADADDGQPNLAMRIMVMVRAAIEKSPPAPCHRKDWTG